LIRVQLDAQEEVPAMEQWKVLLAEKGNSQEVINYIGQYVRRFKEKAAKRDREDLSETEMNGNSIFPHAQSDYTVYEDSSSDTDCGRNSRKFNAFHLDLESLYDLRRQQRSVVVQGCTSDLRG
jgi:hypothetical protein